MKEQQWRREDELWFCSISSRMIDEVDDRCGLGLRDINTPWVQRSVKSGTAALNRAALPP